MRGSAVGIVFNRLNAFAVGMNRAKKKQETPSVFRPAAVNRPAAEGALGVSSHHETRIKVLSQPN
jgi:hypothetical protein